MENVKILLFDLFMTWPKNSIKNSDILPKNDVCETTLGWNAYGVFDAIF